MFETTLNKAVKVFSQLYVGVKPSSDVQWDGKKYAEVTTNSPLAFATPLEKNQAGLKRQETVNTWLRERKIRLDEVGEVVEDERGHPIYDVVVPDIRILDNVPRAGFKITDDIKRVYWGGGNVVFRVYDPNGFELEIQSSNLMALIQVSGINEGGVIPGHCVWGRDGKNNILLHEKSAEYRNAIMGAENAKGPVQVSKTQRVIGSKYLLQDGSQCIYLGTIFAASEQASGDYGSYADLACGLTAVKVKSEVYELNDVVEYDAVAMSNNNVKLVTLYKKAPLIRLVEESPMSRDQLEEFISQVSNTGFHTASNKWQAKIVFVSLDKPSDVKYQTQPVNEVIFNKRLSEYFPPDAQRTKNQINTNMNHFLSAYRSRFLLVGDSVDSLTGLNSTWYNSGVIEKRSGWTDQGSNPEMFFGRSFITNRVCRTFNDNAHQSYYLDYKIGRCVAAAEKMPILSNQTDAVNFLNKQFAEGKIHHSVVVDVEGKVKNLI